MNALFSSESNRPNNRWWLFWILFGTVGYGLGFGISICGYLALWSRCVKLKGVAFWSTNLRSVVE